jgi:hypothetical protein
MKITICGSIAFFDEMLKIKQELENLGNTVKIPPTQIPDNTGKLISVTEYYKIRNEETDEKSWVWDTKTIAIKKHFNKIVNSDCILVLNYTKNEIKNYIGANTFLEMGLALHLDKPIYLLNNLPIQDNKEELLGMKPIIINNNLKLIK